MNAQRRWYELLLLGMTLLLIMATGNIQTAKAQYQYVRGDPQYDHDTYETEEGPGEYNGASSNATPGGESSCSVWADCDANGVSGPSSTYAYASAWGDWQIDWTWSGPPEEAPGGTLDWYARNGRGNAYAWGSNKLYSGSASADALSDADGDISSYGTQGSSSATGGAWGAVQDNDWGYGFYRAWADPWEDYHEGDVTDRDSAGWYSYGVPWEFDTEGHENIPSGTTYVCFTGGADCDCAASANASGDAESSADSDSYASVTLSAEFP
jgi:hypothetical protein